MHSADHAARATDAEEADPLLLRVIELEREAALLRAEAREREEHEALRLHEQKLGAVGRLAAGLAHEINTPLQFIGDNLTFLIDGFNALLDLAARHRAIHQQVAAGGIRPLEGWERAAAAELDTDLAWLELNVRPALSECSDGLDRMRQLVLTMKEFAIPQDRDRSVCDVNEALGRALIVARPEYEPFADVETSLGEVPRVRCSLADLHQVIFNLLVNAAQAIREREAGRGLIRCATRFDQDRVVISVSDDGCGIPDDVRPRIFEQFFTTRDVGAGAGQGLALAWSLVVQKHQGELRFDSQVGRGTTFEVALPVVVTRVLRRPSTPTVRPSAPAELDQPLVGAAGSDGAGGGHVER